MWILDESGVEGPKIVRKEITYVPGLFKIFDEILGKGELEGQRAVDDGLALEFSECRR